MENVNYSITLNDIYLKIQALPLESLPDVYEFVSKLNSEKLKKERACCKPDSIMNTRPLLPVDYKFNRDDLYE